MIRHDPSRLPHAMQSKRTSKRSGTIVSLIWIGGLAVSTQSFAWLFGFQSALGPQLGHCYAPWQICVWAWRWHTEYAEYFMQAGSVGIVVTSTALMAYTLSRAIAATSSSPTDFLHGSARWANKEDMRKASLFAQDGVYVGGWQDPATNESHYLRHSGSEHLLCLAPTRSGKGICLVIPTLLSWNKSCVITDLKGELWALTSGWRKQYAKNSVLRFEPASESGSVGWNPLEEIRLGTEYETGDVQNLATMLVDIDGKGLRDHWQKTAQALLVGCILHLLYQKKNGDISDASLPAVDRMLSNPALPIKELWRQMILYKHLPEGSHPVVGQSAQDMIDRPDEEAGSVLSTTKSYLALYRDPVVGGNVKRSGFKIADLMNHDTPVSLYIITHPDDKTRLKPLVRILINMICRLLATKMEYVQTEANVFKLWSKIWRLLQGKSIAAVGGGRRAKGRYKHKLLMMLDEFPSLGKLEIIQESLAFLAGYGIRFYLICQDITQLRNDDIGYGKDEAISSNCHIQNAFQPNRLETAQYISKLTGQTTIIKEQITTSGHRLGGVLGNVSRTYQEVSRPLMTEDECMRMTPPEKDGDMLTKAGDMLVYVAGVPAVYGQQKPYFFDPIFRARSEVDPPETDWLTSQVNTHVVL